MSLDVYLSMPTAVATAPSSGIFVRRNGRTEEISQTEWNQLYPDREPVVVNDEHYAPEVYSDNITHNLGRMADAAGVYEAMWRPTENGWNAARDLIEPLREGLATLQSDPERFEAFNPENGWGDYTVLVRFVADYLGACTRWPDAEVRVWK